MKKYSTILLFTFCLFNGILICQETKDSLGGESLYPQFYDDFSAEESWQIHKAAYIKQLNNEGLTDVEIQAKIAAYEKRKSAFIKNVEEQKKKAAILVLESKKLREQAKVQRDHAAIQRQKSDELRKASELLRKDAEKRRNDNALQRDKSDEIRKIADIQRQKSQELRKLADIQRKKAEKLREEAEKWRNSFETILSEHIDISSDILKIDPIILEVKKKTTLIFNINGKVSSGSTLVEIFNPRGNKEGELSLEHNSGSNSAQQTKFLRSTSGSLNKTISDAGIGDWKIIITNNNAEGDFNISVARFVKPLGND